MAAITIKNMDVTYNKGKSYVIKDMNLEIKDGEFCVFLGPSGCGKSTAMYCIAGLLHPVHGEICFGNEAMNQLDERGKEKKFVPPQERNIAMVFQEYALYPNMTVRKNMSFALETKKAPKEEIEKRVNSMSAMLGLDELLDRKPAQLSGGQRQRVALGRALVRDPQVFLLDEPLGNLDAKLRDQVRYELKKIQTQLGVTTIYVTHDQTEASQYPPPRRKTPFPSEEAEAQSRRSYHSSAVINGIVMNSGIEHKEICHYAVEDNAKDIYESCHAY